MVIHVRHLDFTEDVGGGGLMRKGPWTGEGLTLAQTELVTSWWPGPCVITLLWPHFACPAIIHTSV